MASITFDDGSGSTVIASGWPTLADRFANWTPSQVPIGEHAHALGDGRRYQWAFRVDYGASFEIPGLQNTDLEDVLRLNAWLLGGGTCTITTDDSLSNVYTECGLAPDAEPELTFDDRPLLEYRLRLTLISVAATPVPLLCLY